MYDPKFQFVTIQVFTPEKSNFVEVDVVSGNADGSFSSMLHVSGPTWIFDCNYPIVVSYNGKMGSQ